MRLSRHVLLFLILIITLLLGPLATQAKLIQADNGELDLSQWDFEKDGNIKLDGNWEFYWNQLIAPGDFIKPEVEMTGYYSVPLYWTKYQGLNLPAKGIATYRIMVETDGMNKSLSIKTPEIYTEYSLWINGQIIDRHGSFKDNKVRYLRPDVYTFNCEDSKIEIVLQIKNQAHYNAGIGQSFIIGTPENIYKERNRDIAIDLIIFAICIFAGCYHIILYLYKKKDYELLCFALFCITVAIRGILSNETFIMQLFPEMPFLVGSKVITLLIPLITMSVMLYAYFMYRYEMPQKLFKILMGLNLFYILLVLITPSFFYSSMFNTYLISVAISCFVILYTAARSIFNGKKESLVFFTGGLFVVIGAFNDMLYFNQFLDTGYYLSLGLVIFTIAQSILLAIRFSRLFNEKQELNEKLLATDLAFMQAQIKPHFIYNALSAISYLTTKDAVKAKELLLDFSDYLRGCFNIENINGTTTIFNEMEIVRAYLSIEKARFRERLNVEYDLNVCQDTLIPMLSIQPIVENAVRHGLMNKLEGGTVKISAWVENGNTHIRVTDNGVGIREEKLTKLLDEKLSSGIALKNINKRLMIKYGTGLIILSRLNEGTTVEMVLPAEENNVKGESA